MKTKKKRYYGMTVSQIGILAGVALVGLLAIGGMFIFIASLGPLPKASLPVATALTVPTVTEAPTAPVLDSTSTPTPAPVAAPSAPPEGWLEFKTPGATIWLPPSFVGGDLVSNKSETINKITRLGRFYGNVVKALSDKNLEKEIVLYTVDKTVKATDVVTSVNVQHIINTEEISLDQYINNYLAGDSQGTPVAMMLTINETKKMTILGREAKRLTYSTTYMNHGLIGLIYYIKDGADIWAVNYSLNPNEYIDMLPMVEQSIQTFNLGQ